MAQNSIATAARGAPAYVHTCRCGAEWTGTLTCHCSGCHCTFTGVSAFDRHRSRSTCLVPAECGLVQYQRGGERSPWQGWGQPDNDGEWWNR